MSKLRKVVGAVPFFAALFLNAFVDLGHKITIQNTIYKLYDGPTQVILTAIVNGLILLPFILLISPAGFLSDKHRKTTVMKMSAWVAVACTVMITIFYYLGWFWPAFVMTFLLAAQSAIYSPAKMGYIKELFGKERLGEANGVASALTIVAILAGTFAYSILFELRYKSSDSLASEADILRVIAPIGFVLILNAIIELIMMYRLPPQAPTGVTAQFDVPRFLTGRLFWDDLSPLRQREAIRLSVIGLAMFWGVGQVMLAAFPSFFKALSQNDNTILVQGILACSGIGIAVGSIVAGKFSKNYIETGLLPLGAAGIALGLLLLTRFDSPQAFALNFLFIGFCGGIFIVPLNSLVQYYAGNQTLGKTLAAKNWVENVTMLSFLVLTASFSYFGWSGATLLQFIAVVALVGSCYVIFKLPQSLTRFVFTLLLTRRYKVNVQGMKNIPAQGGVLLLGNHISWIDWAIVQIASPRPVKFVMTETIYSKWYLTWFFDLFGTIPISGGASSRKSLERVAECLNNGDVVCLFPEGTISRSGHLAEFKKGFERACELANDDVIILPFYLRGLWGSQFSRSSEHLKSSSLSLLKRDIIIAFGKPLDKTTEADVVKRRVFDLSQQAWQNYIDTLPNITRVWINSAKKMGGRAAIIDNSTQTTLSGTRALAGAIMMARRIKPKTHEQSIGILMPMSAGGALVNMATLLSGKRIVNLNYTASKSALRHAIESAEIKSIYTSKRFVKKLEQRGIELDEIFDDLDIVILEDLSAGISSLEKVATLLAVKLLPARVLNWLFGGNAKPDETAAILFSSGSEGVPKGILISHKNILANVKQVADVLNMQADDAIMANLPLFHAFGLTVNQFLPLIEGCPMICHADPTDVVGCSKAIAKYKATIMCATSTFLRLYCKNSKVHPLMLESLRIVVAGAEKLNEDVRVAFGEKFNKNILEGYGATEITPVASVNLPDCLDLSNFKVQIGQKKGSVGMPLPGTSCMIVDPNTFEELGTDEHGMVLVGGAQVMQGYLKNPEKTEEVIKVIDGMRWYVTGDKGYLDKDGYLYIVDRYSRFAKIGGEMVSLGMIESIINNALPEAETEAVVVAVEDAKKGEKLVVLYTGEVDVAALKDLLKHQGVNPLAIPSTWNQVDDLPKLGSGKTDFSLAKKMALDFE